MELEELKRIVYTTDPAAVLVSPRIIRRLLQAQNRTSYLLVQAPHEACGFFDRQFLFRHVEQDELELEPDRLLPPLVILLARPSLEELQAMSREEALLRYWQLLFHAHVHVELHQRQLDGRLDSADVRTRVEQIGATEFEEVRTVLHQENYFDLPADDYRVYCEFAAVYLELRHFRPNLRSTYFPAVRDFAAIDALLAGDLNADAVFERTRPAGAADPVVRTDTSSDESHDYYWKLMRHSDRANREGDIVRAAILHTKAVRFAPAVFVQRTGDLARRDAEQLTRLMQEAIKFGPDEVEDWLKVIPALLDKTDQGSWPVETKILYDLQMVCVEHQRKLFALDVVEWALSAGKRPIKRPLLSLQIVRITKHLRSAAQRLTMARVSDEVRQTLAQLLQSSLRRSEERLRERFRPVLYDAFHDVDLVPASPPDVVALRKIIEELLDRIIEYGFFTFSDLRDTVSRNQLKLPDLADPHSYWQGDPLQRLDRRLSTLLEGVYRAAEFYMRWLESISSLFFGTGVGRSLTLNLVLPFGGAYALLRGVDLCLRDYFNKEIDFPWYSFLILGIFLLGLTHIESLRAFFVEAGTRTGRMLRTVFIDVPSQVWNWPPWQTVLNSWPFLLFCWFVLKPLGVCAVLWSFWPETFGSWPVMAATFVAADLLLNSRFGCAVSEGLTEALSRLYGWLRSDLLKGLFYVINRFFKQVTDTLEYVLYTVDERLRFRSGESRWTMGVRAALGLLWFPVSYLIRLYFVVLIEPSLNPLKLPISSLAAKFLLLIPLYHGLLLPGSSEQRDLINARLTPHTGWAFAVVLTFTIIVPTLWLLPSAFAFFFWEMQGNWRLFRANRPRRLRPVLVGMHGETMPQLLKPGFHSGTVPKLFARLREAERVAYRTGNWRSARTYRQSLHEVARSVLLFVEREFVTLLKQSKSWSNPPIRAGQIELSCTRIRVELCHDDYPGEPVHLAIEERSGWLVASLQESGWLKHLTAEQLQVMTTALAGLYKIAGVDFVREQLAAVLLPYVPNYDLTERHLVVWKGPQNGKEIAYELSADRPRLTWANGRAGEAPKLDARRLFFSRVPLTWDQWVACWQQDAEGKGHPPLFQDGINLLQFESSPKA